MFYPKAVILSVFSVALATGAASGQMQFADAVNYLTPTRPAGIVAADLNRDGIVDLAITTDNPDRVTILLGTGGGAFAAPIRHTIPNGRGLGAIAAGDFDGNGTVDLAVVMKNTGTVAIMNNNGSGYFLLGSLLQVGTLPVDIQVGDLNRDGAPDLVSANRDGESLSVMMNSGDGFFTVQTMAAAGEPHSLALGDINGDGTVDAVVALHRSREVAIFLNIGGVLGTATRTNTAGERPEGVAIGDVNHDGFKDVAFTVTSADGGASLVGLLRGNGSGSFAAASLFPTNGQNSSRIFAADFDNDNFVDVAVTNEGGTTLSVLAGSASGFAVPVLLATGTHPNGIVTADFNADGRMDIACSNRDSDSTSVFLATLGRGCSADVNMDGMVDFNDYLDFMELLSAQAPGADVNHDSVIDGMDYLDFLAGFAVGC